MVPFRSAVAAYTYGNQAFSQQLAFTHPELTLPLLSGKEGKVNMKTTKIENILVYAKIDAMTSAIPLDFRTLVHELM